MTAKNNIFPIIVLGILFFIFGFVTWLNGTLIPYLKIACELNNFQSYLVAFAFYISYFVMALPSSWVLQKTGFKKGMMIGLFVMALGALLFIPAASSRTYYLFLLGLFIIGSGLALLQTASNPYITILGPIESAAKRISIMGICNKIAGTLAPIIMGAIILKDADKFIIELGVLDALQKAVKLDELAQRVITPYSIMALVLVVLGCMVYFSGIPEIEKEEEVSEAVNNKKSVWQHPNLVLGVMALFLYVGAEVIAGDTIGNYGQYQGIELSIAKNFTSLTLIAMIIGYIIGIFAIPKYIKQHTALALSGVLGIVFSLLIIVLSGYPSVLFIALLGLANSLMWPAIWPLAMDGLGKFTKIGSALLIMGIAGGALLPLLYGRLADVLDPQKAYFILIPCYLFILYYATMGHKKRDW
jgi:glucose/galactose transporter